METGEYIDLGCVGYREGWELQAQCARGLGESEGSCVLYLCEHPPTITLGRGARPSEVLSSRESLERCGIEVVETDRGGRATLHAPGQVVAYPILRIAGRGGVRGYLRDLEAVIVGALAGFGVSSGTRRGFTGVWVGDEKIAAIGIRVSRGVAMHGFALNVGVDLDLYRHLVPCGIREHGVTSLARLVAPVPSRAEVVAALVASFARRFGLVMRPRPAP